MKLFLELLLLSSLSTTSNSASAPKCLDSEVKAHLTCEGEQLSLQCPPETPHLLFEFAEYGRSEPEYKICPRPARKPGSSKTSNLSCTQDVLNDLSKLCHDKRTCQVNVTSKIFRDACPETHKYLKVVYICVCPDKDLRRKRDTTTFCLTPRPTVAYHTPIFTTISTTTPNISHIVVTTTVQSVITNTEAPYINHTTATTSKPVLKTSTKSVVSNSSKNGATPKTRMTMNLRRKLFCVLLEMFIIYDETLGKDPTLAILWALLGVLIGLGIMTVIVLVLIKHRRVELKNKMFRLGQLRKEEDGVESPTIRISENPEEPDRNWNKPVNGCERHGYDEDKERYQEGFTRSTIICTNPLWNGLTRENGDGTEENHQDDVRNVPGSPTTPCNKSPKNPRENNNTPRENNSSSRENNGSSRENNNTSGANNSSSRENNSSSRENNNSSRENNNTSRESTENTFWFPPFGENEPLTIPVGIPSRPISMESILYGSHVRWDNSPYKKMLPYVALEQKRRSLGETSSNGNLFSIFGVGNTHEGGYRSLPSKKGVKFSLSDSALSSDISPHLDAKQRMRKVQKPSKVVVPSISLKKQARTRQEPTGKEATESKKSKIAASNDPSSSCSKTCVQPRENKQSKKGALSRVKDQPKINSITTNNNTNQSASNRTSLGNAEKRSSSGYYSNSTSPSVENPLGLQRNRGDNNTNNDDDNQSSRSKEDEDPLIDSDDLPPLPPTPALLSPSHPVRQSIQSHKKDRSVKKVHFER